MASSPQGEATTASLSAAKEGQDQVEMNTLAANASAAEADTQQEHTPSQPATSPNDAGTTSGAEQPTSSSKPPNRLTRAQSEALGPATEAPIHPPLPTTISTTTGEPRGPTLSITLMLTTGARHPYKLDEKYLRSRKVDIPSGPFDPREISGYKLKELIWTDWRNEWEPRPATPASIRLIVMGRLVDDKAVLKDYLFKLDDTNIVHMTIKPADFLDDDDGTGGKGTGKGSSIRGRDTGERGAGCRCVIL